MLPDFRLYAPSQHRRLAIRVLTAIKRRKHGIENGNFILISSAVVNMLLLVKYTPSIVAASSTMNFDVVRLIVSVKLVASKFCVRLLSRCGLGISTFVSWMELGNSDYFYLCMNEMKENLLLEWLLCTRVE